MKRKLFVIIGMLTSLIASSQTYDKKALQFYHNGLNSFFARNYPFALAEFTKAIKLDSGFIQAWENRGVVKYYLNDYEGAISDYNKALTINPEDRKTYGRRAWARFRREDLNGAIDDFSKAIEGNGSDADFHIGRGEAEFRLKEYDAAMADFDRVVRFGYGNREQRGKAFFWLGLIRIDNGQRTGGCLDLNKSKKLGYQKAWDLYDIYCK